MSTGKPTTLQANCPHCYSKGQAFTYVHSYSYSAPNVHGVVIEAIIFKCNGCQEPVIFSVSRAVSTPVINYGPSLKPGFDWNGYSVWAMMPPEPKAGSAPEFTPTNVANFYDQGCRALAQGDYDLAGMGFRKAIDTATKKLIRDLNPADLTARLKDAFVKRIDWLRSQGTLTEQIKEWSHIVRLEGNDAAHEEDPFSLQDAQQLQHFTDMFLQYVFTMPGRVEAYRNPSSL